MYAAHANFVLILLLCTRLLNRVAYRAFMQHMFPAIFHKGVRFGRGLPHTMIALELSYSRETLRLDRNDNIQLAG